MSPRYRLIVFDWDGTLADSAARIVDTVQAAATACGLPPRAPGRIRSIIGLGLSEAVAALYPDEPVSARERLVQGYRESFGRTATTPVELFPGAGPALMRLEGAGLLLGIATGKSRQGLQRELRETGLQDRFVAVRTVDECPSKPHPAMVEELMHECGTTARETLVVGDTLFDLEMAGNAGVDAIAVGWGAQPLQRLARAGPRAVLGDFEELDRWIAGRRE